MADEPTTGELSRRINDVRDEVRAGNRGINERLDKMPTNELLLAYLAKTDTEVAGIKADVDEIKGDISALKKGMTEAKRWAIGTALGAGSLLIAIAGLARSFVS